MIKLSIIVPIYNMEAYLPQCLESIIQQTLQEIEILCIDDGSTDNSEEILKSYSSQDNRIKVLKQDNQGVSKARNRGIDEAEGKYVIFMDPDDWYPDNEILEALYMAAQRHGVSIAGGSFMDYHDGIYNEEFPKRYYGYHFEKEGVIDYEDYQFDFGYQRFIFEKSMLTENGIYFKNYVRYQDPPFLVQAMIAAKRFYGMNRPSYCYRYGHTEIRWNKEKVCDLLCGISDNLDISKKYGLRRLHNLTVLRLNEEYRQLLGDTLFYEEYGYEVLAKMLETLSHVDKTLLDHEELYSIYNPILGRIKEDIQMHVEMIDGLKENVKHLEQVIRDKDEFIREKETHWEEERNELERRTQEVYDSFSYRVGHTITVIPRMIARIAKKD